MVTVRRRRWAPYLLLLPSLLLLTALFLWPLVQGMTLSVRAEAGGVTGEHVARMAADPRFFESVRNTIVLVAVVVPVQFVLAVTMALILQSRPRLRSLLLYTWAVPLAVSDLAAGLVWLSVFTDRGYLNTVAHHLGLGDGYSWLHYEHTTAMFLAVLVAEVWRATALVLVIVVAGLQVIPRDYDEAAAVLGASYWQRLWHVTLPMLRPSLQVALILRTILAFQAFAVAQALTGENWPLLVGETYRWYAGLQNENVAAALAVLVLVISLVTSFVYLRALRTPDAAREVRA